MHIETVAIENYKSFLERQTFQFEPGFNLLVGTNNAGKTTVLDVIDMESGLNEPHRSGRTIPQFGGLVSSQSEFEVALATRFSEFRRLIGLNQLFLPVTAAAAAAANTNQPTGLDEFLAADRKMVLRVSFGHGTDAVAFETDGPVSGKVIRNSGENALSAQFVYKAPDAEPQISIGNYGGLQSQICNYYLQFKQRIYRFSAQRRPGTECGVAASGVLDRETTTLPYCINHLQTNDAHGHRILCGWINRIFPSVNWVQAPPNNSTFQLRCLPHPPEIRRDDLSTPISRMGAGIGNVIAMLYVVLVSREPQVIAIDEPNAYLHPRALRELLAILESEGKQHQFILTAHSADVLTAVKAQTVSLLEFDGVSTTVKQLGLKDLHTIRGGLAELGIRMTDLHAKDQVLWVEGQTEELVMPELLRWACPEVASGTAVLRVERTGTFSTKRIDPTELALIYERLSSSSALVPPMVCILLDGENRSPKDREALEAASRGKLRFLKRRMLENYLLNADAVTAALFELGLPTTSDIVHRVLCENLGLEDLSGDLLEVDGAAALRHVFSELSAASLEFRKTRDVPIILAWILDNAPGYLTPLRECLRPSFGLK